MSNHNIQMKKNTDGVWENLYPFSKTSNIFNSDNSKNVDDLLNDVKESLLLTDNKIGASTNNPTWLKGTLNESLTYLDSYMRDNFIDITKEPWNVPVSNGQDATAKLQYAFDNIPVRKTIYMPNGVYKITSPILINRELTIEGQTAGENGGTLIEVDFSNKVTGLTAIQLVSTAKNSNIRNLYIKNITPSSVSVNGIGNNTDQTPLTHLNMIDVWAVGFAANFFFGKIYLSRFLRCYAVGGFYGFNFDGACTSLLFETCYANQNTFNYRMQWVIYSSFISCANDGAGRFGYELTNCHGLAFVACGVEGASHTAFKLVSGNRGIHFQAPFAHACGGGNNALGSMFHIENDNYGIVIDSAYEYTINESSKQTLSIVAGKETTVTIDGATTILPIVANIPSMVIDGQRKCNIVPNGGKFKQGDMVTKGDFNGTGVYAYICTVSGSPGTWVPLSV